MAIRKQISVTMQNTPGTLAKVCSVLAEKKVNILALMSSELEGKSLVRLIFDKVPAARKALQAAGYACHEEQVLATKLANRPGTIAATAKRLGDAGVNIDYVYSGAEPGSSKQLVVFSVSDLPRARKLIK
ncbi:MAG: ACT domain-containing protein [Acidobacteria bacterium]|nr:ACT domain-containing protein [Acidobacteriota bacterium]